MRSFNLFLLATIMIFTQACVPASPGEIATATPKSTNTPTPVKPTITPIPSITPTPTRTATITPLPTLPSDQAIEFVQQLFTNNRDCRLPCWWGITPGETTWSEARQFLATFAVELGQGEAGPVNIRDVRYWGTNYAAYYYLDANHHRGYTVFGLLDPTENGIDILSSTISGIDVYPPGTENGYQLQQILSQYGVPDDVEIWTVNNFPDYDFYLPFVLILMYRHQGIFAHYEFAATKDHGFLMGCPKGTAPKLILWNPEQWDRSISDLLTEGEMQRIKPLADVTDMDIKTFHQIYSNSEKAACIKTLSNVWP